MTSSPTKCPFLHLSDIIKLCLRVMAVAAASKQKRNSLTLKQRVEVIETFQRSPGMNTRALGALFGCGKTQIGQILKNKESVLSQYAANISGSGMHTSKALRSSEYSEINKALFDWYTLACSKGLSPMSSQLIEKAKEIATHLGKSEFKGSNGWLDKWKKRYIIRELKISGESTKVQVTADFWKECLPEMISGYDEDDIWNMDETGLFWKALPERGFSERGKECNGGKKSQQRITVAFFVTASGMKEKPVVIWKSKNPDCMKKLDKSALPVHYYHQKKAWMSGDIIESILSNLNYHLTCANRHIVLLMDNASCHPEHLLAKFSNIKVCFLPANTTPKLQPLDLGIIQQFKFHYRHFLLKYVLSKKNSSITAMDVTKSINILVAIRWVAKAWDMVSPEAISECFQKADILNSPTDAVVLEGHFLQVDERVRFQNLIDQTMSLRESCGLEEYINGDSDLSVCFNVDSSDNWDTMFLSSLEEEEEEDESEGDLASKEAPPPVINSFKEAIQSLEDVQNFLERKGCVVEAMDIASQVDMLASLNVASSGIIATTPDS